MCSEILISIQLSAAAKRQSCTAYEYTGKRIKKKGRAEANKMVWGQIHFRF